MCKLQKQSISLNCMLALVSLALAARDNFLLVKNGISELRTTKEYTVLPHGETLRTSFKVHSSLYFQSIKRGMGHVIIFNELYVHNLI